MLMDFQQLSKFNILLLGDICQDIFVYGNCERLSPEAPVPVFVEAHRNTMLGMSGNVYNNLSQFPVKINFLSSGHGSTKVRYIDLKSSQHIMRIDEEKNFSPIELPNDLSIYDYVIISDYNKGSISEAIVEKIKQANKTIFVDSKRKDLSIYDGCILKINEKEHKESRIKQNEKVIVTLGSKGASWSGKMFPTQEVEVRDVSGAGDTFFASFVCYYMLTKSFDLSINFANICASQVVQKSGTATLNLKDVKNEICI